MNLYTVVAIFQLIVVTRLFARQLALLADGYEAYAQLICQWRTNQTTTRFHAHDLVALLVFVALQKSINGELETLRVLEQRRDEIGRASCRAGVCMYV